MQSVRILRHSIPSSALEFRKNAKSLERTSKESLKNGIIDSRASVSWISKAQGQHNQNQKIKRNQREYDRNGETNADRTSNCFPPLIIASEGNHKFRFNFSHLRTRRKRIDKQDRFFLLVFSSSSCSEF